MSKSRPSIIHDIKPVRSKRNFRMIPIIVVSILVVPLLVEGAMICYAQWCEVMGTSTEIHTPITDSMFKCFEDARVSFGESIGPGLHRSLGDASIALPVALVFIVLAMAMLKR
jgi:hypothetical protein